MYNGHEYDSILEGKHAKFYDLLNVKHVPHRVSFTISENINPSATRVKPYWGLKQTTRPYGPDFYLVDERTFIEVKPTYPTDEEMDKCERVAQECFQNIAIFYENVSSPYAPLRDDKKRCFYQKDGLRGLLWRAGAPGPPKNVVWMYEEGRGAFLDERVNTGDMRWNHPFINRAYEIIDKLDIQHDGGGRAVIHTVVS
jgi:hypothetical protein